MRTAPRTLLLTAAAMTAFAGNSLLCRAALRSSSLGSSSLGSSALGSSSIDPALFTAVRIAAGAAVLAPLARRAARAAGAAGPERHGSWGSALALAVYAVAFSFAYVELGAALGTLLLFGAVQTTMIGTGIRRGERPSPRVWLGLLAAVAGLWVLLHDNVAAGSAAGSLAMLAAGVAWGIYSLRGRGSRDPLAATAGNFARAVVLVLPPVLVGAGSLHANATGVLLASISGAITSGLGYVIWYAAVRGLSATQAAIAQLTVPILAASLALLWLGETMTAALLEAGALVLGGVGTAMTARR